jgi:hypothetical protein
MPFCGPPSCDNFAVYLFVFLKQVEPAGDGAHPAAVKAAPAGDVLM